VDSGFSAGFSAGFGVTPGPQFGTWHWNVNHNDFTGDDHFANVGQPHNLGADVGLPGGAA
jgi:hypothetical protein